MGDDVHIKDYPEDQVIGKTLKVLEKLDAEWDQVWPLMYKRRCIAIVDSDGHAWLGDYDREWILKMHDPEASDYLLYDRKPKR